MFTFLTWEPNKDLRAPEADARMLELLKRAVYGQTVPNGHTLYQLMPWSWLNDWFSSCGDYLSLTNNLLGATIGQCCAVQRITTEHHLIPDGNIFNAGPALIKLVEKGRHPLTPGIAANLPFITPSRALTMSAFAARLRR